jgi:hypothetical protein
MVIFVFTNGDYCAVTGRGNTNNGNITILIEMYVHN